MAYQGLTPKVKSIRANELMVGYKDTYNLSVGNNNNILLPESSLIGLTASGAGAVLTGINPAVVFANAAKILILTNDDATDDIEISNLDANSTAANRITTGTGGNITLSPGMSLSLVYGGGNWNVVGGTGSGSGSGTFKNYLPSWFDGEKNPGTLSVGTVSASGNRTAPDTSWAATSATATVVKDTSSPLRGKGSIFISPTNGNSNGSLFVETPVFTMDRADVLAATASLYTSFVLTTGSTNFDVALVRYNSSGVFQSVIPIVGTGTLSAATPPSQIVPNGALQRRYFGASVFSAPALTDKFALRFRVLSSGFSLTLEDLYVGPHADLGVDAQRFIGEKQFADTLEAREGVDVPNTLDFTGTLTVAATETKMVGKLDIASGTTITVTGNLVTVGSITGSGTLNGSGTVVSI